MAAPFCYMGRRAAMVTATFRFYEELNAADNALISRARPAWLRVYPAPAVGTSRTLRRSA